MKRFRAAWLTALVLCSVVLLLLFFPARWALPLVQPRLHGVRLGAVHGLLWDGAADDVRAAGGQPLGRVHWQLARSALWGRLDLQLQVSGQGLRARGRLQRDAAGRPVWSDVLARVQLRPWAAALTSALGTPQGELTIRLQQLTLQADWPMAIAGQVHWPDAAFATPGAAVALGTLEMELAGSHGVLRGELHDADHGPLAAQGHWQASPLGWQLDLQLRPRSADPVLRGWLARLGRPAADGAVELHRRGGLAAAQEASP